jgi:hypothetical protein
MFNFYLYNKSYEKANSAQLEENLLILNDLAVVEHAKEDFFCKNDSIWDVVDPKIQNEQFRYTVLPKLFGKIASIQENFSTLEEFDQAYSNTYNAFYGVFDEPVSERHINDKETYLTFKDKHLWDLTPTTLWERRAILFSKLILCPSVKDNLEKIGSSKYFSQIVDRLKELNRYAVEEWTEGNFEYRKARKSTSLDISPESESTMSLYGDQRLFKMHEGRSEYFSLHIKTGDFRFHIYPENGKIFVGYIGKHLSTATDK